MCEERHALQARANERMLLRDFLRQLRVSKRQLAAAKYGDGQLLVNGQERTVRHIVEPGDAVEIRFAAERGSAALLPEDLPLSILYEDRAVLVVDKPPGMPTIPSREHPSGTLAGAALFHLEAHGIRSAFHAVTRLDRDTSGAVLIAKSAHVHHLLSEALQAGEIEKCYFAIARGRLEGAPLCFCGPIGRQDGSIIAREVRRDGRPARTEVEAASAIWCAGEELSAVRCRLLTGRTHQIRVHLAAAGHPIAGDSLYGGEMGGVLRQALHAHRLRFPHPLTGEPVEVEAPLPEDIQKFFKN